MNAQSMVNDVPLMAINMVREAYQTVNGTETSLTNEQIADIIKEQGDEADSMSAEQWAETLLDIETEGEEKEQPAKDVLSVSASDVREEERRLAGKLASDEWKAFQTQDIETGDFRKQVTVRAAVLITKDFSKQERDALPVFGTTAEGDAENNIPPSNNPDVYNTKGRNGKNEKRHRLWDIVDVSPVGSYLWDYYGQCYDARHNVEGADKALFAKGPIWLDSEMKMVRQRINTIRKSFIEGLAIVAKTERINSELPNDVKVEFEVDSKGQLRRGAYCIAVNDKKNPRAFSLLSAGQLLKLNLVKAAAMGGTYEALVSTIARGKKTDAGTPAATVTMPKTKEEAYSMVQMLNHFFDANSADGRKRIATVIGEMASKGEGAESAIESLGDLYHALDGLFPKFESAYNKLKAKQIETKAAAA